MKTFEELIDKLFVVEKLGFVKTHRRDDTGVGKTLEDLLGVIENNFKGPNGFKTELKFTRKNSTTMIYKNPTQFDIF